MAILSVRTKNYKQHKDLHLKLDGKNTFFVGDTKQGKTNILRLIQAANMQVDFPTNPLTTGEEFGSVEVIEDLNGEQYTMTRKFSKNNNGRWELTDKNGAKPKKSLTAILEGVLGRALKNYYFDYTIYFFGLKSSKARADYMINAIGGSEVAANNKLIKEKKEKRAKVGKDRAHNEAVYAQLGKIDTEKLPELLEKYSVEKTKNDANAKYDEIIATQKPIEELQKAYDVFYELHDKKSSDQRRLSAIDDEISELELKLTALKEERVLVDERIQTNEWTRDKQLELNESIKIRSEENHKILIEAESAYETAIQEVIDFGLEKKNFFDSVQALQSFEALDAEWNTIDEEISELEAQNKELFKSKLPIPELSVTAIEKENDKGNIEVEEIVMYKGREFSFEELSKGESIAITAEIQNALNPGGNNFIVIPEANLLGSDLDEVLEQCKKFKIQALVEVTQRKQDFKIVFEEEFLN